MAFSHSTQEASYGQVTHFRQSPVRKTVEQDISLRRPSASLWQLHRSEPEIRQIYGHFLPPFHRKLVRGLVAKDFNFPAAYHAAGNLSRLNELYANGERFAPDTIVSTNGSIKTRVEEGGAIIYTPYFNGFYMNKSAYEIWKCCEGEVPVISIASESGYDLGTVVEFLARVLMLGLVNVHSS